MKPLTGGQIFALIAIGLVTMFYLSVKNYSSDDNEYGKYQILIEKSFELDNQNLLEIDLSSENIYVTSGDTDSFEIKYENYAFSTQQKKELEDRLVIEDTGSVIRIYKEPGVSVNLRFFDSIAFFFENGFRTDMVNGSLHVVVPEGYSHNVDVDSSSGEVTVDYLDIDSFNVKASSGDIELDHINANDMTAKTSSEELPETISM